MVNRLCDSHLDGVARSIDDALHPAYKVTLWQNFDSFIGALSAEHHFRNGQVNVLCAPHGTHLLKK